MTNGNKPDKQAVRHSREPWKVTTTEYQQAGYPYAIISFRDEQRGNDVISAHVSSEANAVRIVACVNFCAGIHIETLTLANQADHPTLNQICEENQSLRKQLAEASKEASNAGRPSTTQGPNSVP